MTEHPHEEEVAPQPHDGFVKRIFSKPEVAAVELCQVLPAAVVACLDWSTLRVEPGSFVSPTLRTRATDILYSVGVRDSGQADQAVLLYVLMEHQSKLQRMMAVRLLIYVARIWERYLDSQAKKGPVESIPLIVPVLLYHGPEGWTMPRRLSELFDLPPKLAQSFPSPIELVFDVDDLRESIVRDRDTRDQHRAHALALAEVARTLMWLAFHPEEVAGPRVERLGALLDEVSEAWGLDELQTILTYIVSAFGLESPLQGILLESASKETTHMFVSIKDDLIAKGRADGIAKGRADGIAKGRADGIAKGRADGIAKGRADGLVESLERLLERRDFPLTHELRQRIAGCDDENLLLRWFDRAVTATALAEVFDD